MLVISPLKRPRFSSWTTFLDFLLLHACLRAEAQTFPAPTPAGEALGAYLQAFNSENRAHIGACITEYDPAQSVDGMLAFSAQTDGFTFLSIERSTLDAVSFLVRAGATTSQPMGFCACSAPHGRRCGA